MTGHTGFKGAWLAFWLARMGAAVIGFADGVPTSRSLFADLGLSGLLDDRRGDVRDADAVAAAVAAGRPAVILHLAAQSLVRRSYGAPAETWDVNVMGTVHVLEAARALPGCTVVAVTTDKCYENREWPWPYREADALGGHDPYSASKAGAELAAASFARAYGLKVASARAGNVFGGGDWAEDRLVPDMVRGLSAGRSTAIRHPGSVRPWQHVLEPLCGYLLLAERAAAGDPVTGEGWNFGPDGAGEVDVATLADTMGRLWPRAQAWHPAPDPGSPHEADTLRLDSSKARTRLGWRPRWTLEEGLAATVEMYRSADGEAALRERVGRQIDAYLSAGAGR